MRNENEETEVIEIQMATPLSRFLYWGIFGAFIILAYMAANVPWVVYAAIVMGMVSWHLFVHAYNLACSLTNQGTMVKFLKELDKLEEKGTLSDNDGLSNDEEEDEDNSEG